MGKKLAAILLAAGYGTRLTRDLEREKETYGHLLGLPKPLLPVQGFFFFYYYSLVLFLFCFVLFFVL